MSSRATGGSNGRALAWAEEAHRLVQAHPRRARALAERALAQATSGGDADAEVAARYALGWAQFLLGDPVGAKTTLRTGIRVANRHDNRHGAGLLRRHLAYQLAIGGHVRAAQDEISIALDLLTGLERARSQVHRLDIHRKSHVTDPAVHRRVLADAAAGLRRLREERDEIWEARLLFNRGLVHLDRGELDLAEADVVRARALYERADAATAVANVVPVIAGIAALRGEVVTCLKLLGEVDAARLPAQLGYNLAHARVVALMQARLLPEARAACESYIDLCARTGGGEFVGSALLDLAAIAAMSGDPASARNFASKSARSFAARGKLVNAALARAVVLRARLFDGDVDRASVRSGLAAASVLTSARWRVDARRTRLLVARLALAAGLPATARTQLELARPIAKHGTVADRIELYHARALLDIAEGRPESAERRLYDGLRLLDEYRAALGAAELRATSSGIGIELARVGLGLAMQSTQPARVLRWAEALRASALRHAAVRPPSDAKLRALQTELRRAVSDRATARQAELETAIRARTLVVEPPQRSMHGPAGPRSAEGRLEGRALVEYVELNGVLRALTLAEEDLVLHELGGGAAEELEWLRFAYARLSAGRLSPEQRAATLANAAASAAALDEALVKPLAEAVGDAPLVIVPTGALHALPWAALPSLRERPLVVAPSLALWSDLAARPRSHRRKVVLVAGPRLRHVSREVHDIGALRPGATVLTGKGATAEATLAALDGAAIAHLACHGHFRADSPLFSSLELADGPLNVYELQGLRRAPELVVLSACDLAQSQTHPGDELLGLAAALLGMGTRTIVASVVPVPDAAARHVMLAFHRHLLDGLTPADALARAQARARTAGFVCLGAG